MVKWNGKPFVLYSQDRASTAEKIVKEKPNSFLIPPFDHPHIIAGQGTIAVELLDQVWTFNEAAIALTK